MYITLLNTHKCKA
uniref:Uncharacterized protein n=1 Tax=Arundo donax TaxID=35708 RepID=A0A0A9R0D9_ARUDO